MRLNSLKIKETQVKAISSDEEIQELIATERSNWIKLNAIDVRLKMISQETENILKLTDLTRFNFKSDSRTVYICVENHFHTRWLCLLPSAKDIGSDELLSNLKNLKCNNLRLFSMSDVPASLKASFPDLQIVSDSH